MKDFDHKMYVALRKESVSMAEKYREECWLINQKEDDVQEIEAPKDAEIVETLSIEDMKSILDTNSIKYSHLAKEKGLMKLLEENKLI